VLEGGDLLIDGAFEARVVVDLIAGHHLAFRDRREGLAQADSAAEFEAFQHPAPVARCGQQVEVDSGYPAALVRVRIVDVAIALLLRRVDECLH